jgi:uncharacterized protein (DUF1501 family)
MLRRHFLALGCSAAASPLLTPVVLAQAPWDNRLVVIILRGALDGLDAIQPRGDAAFAGLRPTLAGVEATALTDFWHLHPALAPLLPLWQAGEFGAVHAVSTPYRDRRSHFDGQDILEAGTAALTAGSSRDGWLNRMLQAVPGVVAETGYAIGPEQMLILAGDAPVSRWTPEARLTLSPQARQLVEIVQHDDPLFRDATLSAMNIVDGLEEGAESGGQGHIRLARFAANRLREETRVASFSLGGWDTHARQAATLPRALERLADVIVTLRDDLGPVWGQTAVLCVTEFGRTVRENGTFGTDHGTGGALLYAGGALKGGQVAGDWPGLADLYADRDLLPTRDVRAHAAWVMKVLMGLNDDVLAGAVFPGLDLGPAPGILL